MDLTPGNWGYEPGDQGDRSVGLSPSPPTVGVEIDDDWVIIATIHEPWYQDGSGEGVYCGDPVANGRLLSASKDLLVACQIVPPDRLELIAKMLDVALPDDPYPEIQNDLLRMAAAVRAALAKAEVKGHG